MPRGKKIKAGGSIAKPIVDKTRLNKAITDLKGLPKNISSNLIQTIKASNPTLAKAITAGLKTVKGSSIAKKIKKSVMPLTGKGSTIKGIIKKSK